MSSWVTRSHIGPFVPLDGIAVGRQQGRKVFTLQTLPAGDEPFGDSVGQAR